MAYSNTFLARHFPIFSDGAGGVSAPGPPISLHPCCKAVSILFSKAYDFRFGTEGPALHLGPGHLWQFYNFSWLLAMNVLLRFQRTIAGAYLRIRKIGQRKANGSQTGPKYAPNNETGPEWAPNK